MILQNCDVKILLVHDPKHKDKKKNVDVFWSENAHKNYKFEIIVIVACVFVRIVLANSTTELSLLPLLKY